MRARTFDGTRVPSAADTVAPGVKCIKFGTIALRPLRHLLTGEFCRSGGTSPGLRPEFSGTLVKSGNVFRALIGKIRPRFDRHGDA